MSLDLFARLDRNLVPSEGATNRFLLLTLVAPPMIVKRTPINLALVIDRSGSMGGQKLARAREAATYVVRQLTSADRVAIVTYDDDVVVLAPSARLMPEKKVDLLGRISGIHSGGSTNLSGGWLTGCEQVASHQQAGSQLDRVLVLTDGLANVGITDVESLAEHARQLRRRGVMTSTMGIGVDFNEELLATMARHGGGRFQYVETAKAIPDCVHGELGELLSIGARGLSVEIVLPEGVQLIRSLNDDILEPAERGMRVLLGDLLAGDTRSALLDVRIEPGRIGELLPIAATAAFIDGVSGQPVRQSFPTIVFHRVSPAEAERQGVDEVVGQDLARVLAADAREEAARLARRGDHQGASNAVAAAIDTLGSMPSAAPADIAALEALRGEAARGLSRERQKQEHYGSYLSKTTRRSYGNHEAEPSGSSGDSGTFVASSHALRLTLPNDLITHVDPNLVPPINSRITGNNESGFYNSQTISPEFLTDDFYLDISWKQSEAAAIVHVGTYRLCLASLLEQGYVRKEATSGRIRLILRYNTDTSILYLQLNTDSPRIDLARLRLS